MSKFDLGYSSLVSWNTVDETKQKMFKEALAKSKGKVNNQLGALLLVAGASVDDIVKYASEVTGRQFYAKPAPRKMDADDKASRFAAKLVPNFWDTVKGKYMKEEKGEVLKKVGLNPEKPLPASQLDIKLSQRAINVASRMTGKSYAYNDTLRMLRYNSTLSQKFTAAEIFEPLVDVKFKFDYGLEYLMQNTAYQLAEVHLPDYQKNRKYEIDSLAHLKPEVAAEIKPMKLMVDLLEENFGGYFRHDPNSKWSVEIMCVMEAFYDVCKEMGIVGVVDSAVAGRTYITSAATKGIMKNVIRLAGTYRKLVKGGFAESVAREAVLAEINENIEKRATRPVLRFYGRDDYKDTPEEERVQKKATNPSGGSSQKRVFTFDELGKVLGGLK